MKIAVMGYGTIGSGVVEVLEINKEKIAKRAGEPIEVKYVLDLREFPGTPIENKIVHDYKVIAEDPEIGIVVETMGGVEPAFTFVKAMLEAGKQVATSNKNLVAAKGAELIKVARDHGVNFQFEASVGGGIPIIRPLNKCLTADEIEEITGILNGTTNYMLTKMTEEGADFDEVLKDAQDKGYAEKDPTADIEGHDPCSHRLLQDSRWISRISTVRVSQRLHLRILSMQRQCTVQSSFLLQAARWVTAIPVSLHHI